MADKTPVYNKDYADGLSKKVEEIDGIISDILSMNFETMQKNPHIGMHRAPIFTAACIIFKTIYEELQIETLTASLKGAQEAIIDDLVAKWQN